MECDCCKIHSRGSRRCRAVGSAAACGGSVLSRSAGSSSHCSSNPACCSWERRENSLGSCRRGGSRGVAGVPAAGTSGKVNQRGLSFHNEMIVGCFFNQLMGGVLFIYFSFSSRGREGDCKLSCTGLLSVWNAGVFIGIVVTNLF